MDGGGYYTIKITLTMEKCDESPGLCIANDGRWKMRNTQGIIPLHHPDENIPLSEMARKSRATNHTLLFVLGLF